MNRGEVGLHDIALNSKWTMVFRTEAEKHSKWEKNSVIREGDLSYWSNPTESTMVEQSKRLLGLRNLKFHSNLQHDRKVPLVRFTSCRL
jgi:hypothetical protein